MNKLLIALFSSSALASSFIGPGLDVQDFSQAPSWYTNFNQQGKGLCFVASGEGDSEDIANKMATINALGSAAKNIVVDVSKVKLVNTGDALEEANYLKSIRTSAFTGNLGSGKHVKKHTVKSGDKFIQYIMVEMLPNECSVK